MPSAYELLALQTNVGFPPRRGSVYEKSLYFFGVWRRAGMGLQANFTIAESRPSKLNVGSGESCKPGSQRNPTATSASFRVNQFQEIGGRSTAVHRLRIRAQSCHTTFRSGHSRPAVQPCTGKSAMWRRFHHLEIPKVKSRHSYMTGNWRPVHLQWTLTLVFEGG